jgi:hypothetical protein
MNQELVTRKQVAAFFGVTNETIYNWEKKSIVQPFCSINGRPRYKMNDVIRSVSESKGGKLV